MLRFAADENFRGAIVAGLRRRNPAIDIVTVQERGLRTWPDPRVLEWAAGEGRVLLTHDVKTMGDAARERTEAGLPMPGVFVVRWVYPVGAAIEELEFAAIASLEGEWEHRVEHLPLP